jgi:GT2 family glycosyltransferase
MLISVVIPTYRRPRDLSRCLEALGRQIRLADEVIIVIRDTDNETWDLLKTFYVNTLTLKLVTINVAGVIAAMNAGLDIAKGDIIAFTDDDASPHNNWLKKIEDFFLVDNQIGGVGGRDFLYMEDGLLIEGEERVVGKLQWFGRVIGNHHLGAGGPREVDILKGVNMSFRREAILDMHFDSRMLGTGAQVHFEIEFCLRLKKAGWKLIYDPEILVDHYCGKRFDEDVRWQFNNIAFFNEVHNETLALLEYLSPLTRLVFFVWCLVIGHKRAFGVAQLLRFLPSQGKSAIHMWSVSIRGRFYGWSTWKRTKSLVCTKSL